MLQSYANQSGLREKANRTMQHKAKHHAAWPNTFFKYKPFSIIVIFSLAPFIKPCKLDDRQCVIQSAQAALPIIAPGIPELKVPSLDPLRIDLVKGDQGSLKLTFRDTDVNGMKGCSVDNAK